MQSQKNTHHTFANANYLKTCEIISNNIFRCLEKTLKKNVDISHNLHALEFAGFFGFLLGYDLGVGRNGSGGGKSVGKRNCCSNSTSNSQMSYEITAHKQQPLKQVKLNIQNQSVWKQVRRHCMSSGYN